MATKASSSSSLSPCIRLMEESLLLPTQDAGLFAKIFLLIFAHTFFFIAVAVHLAHPLAASILADDIIKAHKTTTTTDTAKELWQLLAIYLSYLASKLAAQLVTALATAATYYYSGERLSRHNHNKAKAAAAVSTERRIGCGGGVLGTAALAGVLELLLTALLVSTWTYYAADSSSSGTIRSLCGYSIFSVALLLYLYLATVIAVSVGVSAVDGGGGGRHGVRALRRAWRLMGARRKEAALLVFVVNLLPALICPAPVYSFSSVTTRSPADYSLFYGQELAARFSLHDSEIRSQGVWLIGVASGSGLPFVGAQLFSMVAATVFCCLSVDTNDGALTSV